MEKGEVLAEGVGVRGFHPYYALRVAAGSAQSHMTDKHRYPGKWIHAGMQPARCPVVGTCRAVREGPMTLDVRTTQIFL